MYIYILYIYIYIYTNYLVPKNYPILDNIPFCTACDRHQCFVAVSEKYNNCRYCQIITKTILFKYKKKRREPVH